MVHDGIAQIDEEGDSRVSSSASDVHRLSASDNDGCDADDCAQRGAFGWLCIASGQSRDIEASEPPSGWWEGHKGTTGPNKYADHEAVTAFHDAAKKDRRSRHKTEHR